MEWELLTAPQLKKAIDDGAMCILPFGVLEKHGDHLPLGTDTLRACSYARRAAEVTGDVVFPNYYLGQINEGRHCIGAIAIDPVLCLQCLQAVCDEIGRNGFKKVVIYNSHGGNAILLSHFLQVQLHREKSYTVYAYNYAFPYKGGDFLDELVKYAPDGVRHAGGKETGEILGLYGKEMVDMTALRESKQSGEALGRLKHLDGSVTSIRWYANHPDQYAGDAHLVNLESGKELARIQTEHLVEYFQAVKADQVAPVLEKEFYERSRNPQ